MKAIKNILVSFLAVCILAFSGGINIVQHYCGNTLKRTSFNKTIVDCCAKDSGQNSGIKTIKKHCCSEEINFFKTSDFNQEKIVAMDALIATPAVDFIHPKFEIEVQPEVSYEYSLPPPKNRIHITTMQFLI